jgi:hypothetical protein
MVLQSEMKSPSVTVCRRGEDARGGACQVETRRCQRVEAQGTPRRSVCSRSQVSIPRCQRAYVSGLNFRRFRSIACMSRGTQVEGKGVTDSSALTSRMYSYVMYIQNLFDHGSGPLNSAMLWIGRSLKFRRRNRFRKEKPHTHKLTLAPRPGSGSVPRGWPEGNTVLMRQLSLNKPSLLDTTPRQHHLIVGCSLLAVRRPL